MPRVVRQYKRQDFSALLKELNQGVPSPPSVSGSSQDAGRANTVSVAKRRRDSLMDNRKMRFAYSAKANVIHDRDCPNVANIPDEDFRMLAEFSTDMHRCDRCYRRALIRAGMLNEDHKWMTAYERIFALLGARVEDLYTLIIQHQAKLYGVGSDFVHIRVRDDKWMICIRSTQYCLFYSLYHNNYSVTDNYERVFGKGFHLQNDNGNTSFRNYVRIMTQYTWESHVESFKAQELELRRDRCRANLQKFKNILEKNNVGYYVCTFRSLSASRMRPPVQRAQAPVPAPSLPSPSAPSPQ